MCNVCCAENAIRDTAAGGSALFWWNPSEVQPEAVPNETPRERARRRRALRIENATPSVEEPDPKWPRIYLQATGESEGPGQVRASFDNATWTAWVVTTDVAGIVGALGVDVRWSAISRLKLDPVLSILLRDLESIERIMQATSARHIRFDAGLVDGRKAAKKRTPRTMLNAISDALRVASAEELNLSAYLAAFACGLRHKGLKRRRSRAKNPARAGHPDLAKPCPVCMAVPGEPCFDAEWTPDATCGCPGDKGMHKSGCPEWRKGTPGFAGSCHIGRTTGGDPLTVRHVGFAPDGGAILETVEKS